MNVKLELVRNWLIKAPRDLAAARKLATALVSGNDCGEEVNWSCIGKSVLTNIGAGQAVLCDFNVCTRFR